MKLLFWLCFAFTVYAYFGYAVWLWFYVQLHRQSVAQDTVAPTVSIVIAARNEEANLAAKLENLRRLNYPQDRLQVVIASDGSTDRTASILRSEQVLPLVPVILEESNGKALALNQAVKHATGEILVFLDARQSVDPNAVSELTSCFADPAVGAVSGELLLEDAAGASSTDALGIYWKIEKIVRKLESASGSVVGVTGAIYAIRREFYTEIPAGTILDDVFVPMHVARSGKRVVFQSAAIARDRLFSEKGKEFFTQGPNSYRQLSVAETCAMAAIAGKSSALSLCQPQTSAARRALVPDRNAGLLRPGRRSPLQHDLLAPGLLLSFSRRRNGESFPAKAQTGGHRQYLCHA